MHWRGRRGSGVDTLLPLLSPSPSPSPSTSPSPSSSPFLPLPLSHRSAPPRPSPSSSPSPDSTAPPSPPPDPSPRRPAAPPLPVAGFHRPAPPRRQIPLPATGSGRPGPPRRPAAPPPEPALPAAGSGPPHRRSRPTTAPPRQILSRRSVRLASLCSSCAHLMEQNMNRKTANLLLCEGFIQYILSRNQIKSKRKPKDAALEPSKVRNNWKSKEQGPISKDVLSVKFQESEQARITDKAEIDKKLELLLSRLHCD